MSTETPQTRPATLADIAPLPHPDTADVAAVTRWLLVRAIRLRVRAEANSDRPPTPDEMESQDAHLAALHFARALDFVCGHPSAALPRRADRTAQEVATAWRGGDHGECLFIDHDERLFIYCSAFGLDYEQVRRLAEAELALRDAESDAGGLESAGADEETPEPPAGAVALDRIRELAESWTEDDGWGERTREMTVEAACARQILAIIGGETTGSTS